MCPGSRQRHPEGRETLHLGRLTCTVRTTLFPPQKGEMFKDTIAIYNICLILIQENPFFSHKVTFENVHTS